MDNIIKKEKISNNDKLFKEENLKNNFLMKFNDTYKKILFDNKSIVEKTNEDINYSKNKIENIKNELKFYFNAIENLEKDYLNEIKNFKKVNLYKKS
jgi:hypothetical protein